MPVGSISQAIKLVSSGNDTKSTYTYHFATTMPTYQSGLPTGFSTSPTASGNYAINAADFGNLAISSESAFASSLTAILQAAGLGVDYSSSPSADIVVSGLNVTLYTGGLEVAAFAIQPNDTYGDLASDIWILQGGSVDAFSLQRSVQHELLHTVGLADVTPQSAPPIYTGVEDSGRYTIMSYKPHPGEGRSVTELQLYDIAALQAIYGRNDATNSGDTVHQDFTVTINGVAADRIYSIWDGGGNDAIDASAFVQPALIDLRPGHFSSIGPFSGVQVTAGENPNVVNAGTLNISIAFGAYIENATGSEAGDLIIGNVLSNVLEGGAGDDVIYGEGAASIHEQGDGTYQRVTNVGATKTEDAPESIMEFADDTTKQEDHLSGGDGDDYLHGSRGDDLIEGGEGDDILVGGEGDDQLWGGTRDAEPGANDGKDTALFSTGDAGIVIAFQERDGSVAAHIEDGDGGTDTLHSIEIIEGTGHDDTLLVSRMDANLFANENGQGGVTDIYLGDADTADEVRFDGLTEDVTVDLALFVDGDEAEIRVTGDSSRAFVVSGAEKYLGGEGHMTVFSVGDGEYYAGAGGMTVHMQPGDIAIGHDGAVDIFHVSTIAPAGLTDAEKIEWLAGNRIFIGNFGDEDQLVVNGIAFDGNQRTSTVETAYHVEVNLDIGRFGAINVFGESSYGIEYPYAEFVVMGDHFINGQPGIWGQYRLPETAQVRDVTFTVADGSGVGLIEFIANEYSFDYLSVGPSPLSPDDEALTIVIQGFENGEGGITFSHDSWSAPSSGYSHTMIPEEVLPADSGSVVNLGDPSYDGGYRLTDRTDIDWQAYVRGEYSGPSLELVETTPLLAEELGHSRVKVTFAGDVNGDGFDDLLIGDPDGGEWGPYYSYSSGGAYLVFGNEQGVLPSELGAMTPDEGIRIESDSDLMEVGSVAIGIGDYNGDGFDDILVNGTAIGEFDYYAYQYYGSENHAYVIYGGAGPWTDIDLDELDQSRGIELTGSDQLWSYRHSMAALGDIDGDGFDDFGVGQWLDDTGGNNAGGVTVMLGGDHGAAGLDLTALPPGNGFFVGGTIADSFTGRSVAAAGDMNGDGIDDFLIGAPGANGGAGMVYVIYGRTTGFGSLSLDALAPGDGFTISSGGWDSIEDTFSALGDFDGDGYDDVAVATQSDTYVVYGGPANGDIDLDGSAGRVTKIGPSYGYRNVSLPTAGDTNGDGLADFVLSGNPLTVIFGQVGGIDIFDVGFVRPWEARSYEIAGHFGSPDQFSGGGDFDGNGTADFIVFDVDGYPRVGELSLVLTRPDGGTAVTNAAPTAGDDGLFVGVGGSALTIRTDDLLANDADADGDAIVLVSTSDGAHGTVTRDANGDIVYSPDAGFVGQDSFIYTIGDGTASATAHVTVTIHDPAADWQFGTAGDDRLYGNDGVGNRIHGRAGSDAIFGGGNDDVLSGAAGDDILIGREGDDTINGGKGDDLLDGGPGSDILAGGAGQDMLSGGAGNDILNGGSDADVMAGGAGDDYYVVDSAQDVVTEAVDGGVDRVRATIDYSLGSEVEDLSISGIATFGEGNALDNTIRALDLGATLLGHGGDDLLLGSAEADALYGGDGTDALFGRAGDDSLFGEDGDDSLRGQDGDDVLEGGSGDDRLAGDGGSDDLLGGAGSDAIFGGDGDDSLSGGDGDDFLRGNAGNDVIAGGAGRDSMRGGEGADVFRFDALTDLGSDRATADRIVDFAVGDLIDLQAIDAIAASPEDDQFTLIGETSFTATAGELRYFKTSSFTFIEADIDGDGVGDFILRLDGAIDLSASDFIL